MTAHPRVRLYVFWTLLIAFDVAIQVLMKLAGDRLGGIRFELGWLAVALSSWLVWLSIVGYFATFILWLAILHSSSLSAAFPATALVYALVPLSGWLILHEQVTIGRICGISLILAGVVLQRDSAGGRSATGS